MSSVNLPKAHSKYGASMGRYQGTPYGLCKLQRVHLSQGGYDRGGAYWGTGQPLFCCEDSDGEQAFIRADNREQAKSRLQTAFNVRFYR